MLRSVQRDTLWIIFALAIVAVSPTANAARLLQGAAHNASADNAPGNIAFNFSAYGVAKETEVPPTPPLTATTSSAQASAQVLPGGNSIVADEAVLQLQQLPAGSGTVPAARQATLETVPTGWMNATIAKAWRTAHHLDATAAAHQPGSPIFVPVELVRGINHTSGAKLLPTATTRANAASQQLPTGSVAPHTAAVLALPSTSSSGAVVRAQGAGPGQPWPANDKLRNPNCMVSDSTTISCITSPNGYFKLCVQPDGDITLSSQALGVYWTSGRPEGVPTGPVTAYLCLEGAYLYSISIVGGLNIVKLIAPGALLPTPMAAFIQDDGNFVVYDEACKAMWSTGTVKTPGPVLSPCWPASGERQLEVGSKTWLLFQESRTYTEARSSCQARSGELLTVLNADENELLYQTNAGVSYDVWFGLAVKPEKAPSASKDDWVWLSLNQTPAYQNWRAETSEPNNSGGGEGVCAELWLAAGGAWNDADCSLRLPYACQLGCSRSSLPQVGPGTLWRSNCDAIMPGRFCYADCDTDGGYLYGQDSGTYATCTSNGSWEITSFGGKTCIPESEFLRACRNISAPQDLNATWPEGMCYGTAPGASCNATCSPGFVAGPSGPPTATCYAVPGKSIQYYWTEVQGSCIDCGLNAASVLGRTNDTVCPTASSKTLTFSLNTGSTRADINVTSVQAVVVDASNIGCTATRTQGKVQGSSNVSVTCERIRTGPWPLTFTVNASASLAVPSTACQATPWILTTVTRQLPATLTFNGPVAAAVVCPLEASRVLNYTFTTAPEAVALSNITVRSSGPVCTVTPSRAAAVGSTLSVSCSRPTTGLWAPFSLNLTGVTAADSCGSTGSITSVTPVSVAQEASLTRTSQNTATCPAESTTTATFLVNSSVAGASFAIVPRAGSVSCSASPSIAVTSGTPVTVTCNKPTSGWPATSFTLSITAVDQSRCTANVTTTTVITTSRPAVTIRGPTTAAICATATQTTFSYALSSSVGGALNVVVSTNSTSVECNPKTTSVTSGTNLTVTCGRAVASQELPASFRIVINATSGAGACANSTGLETVVRAPCCASGTTYARSTATGAATCLTNTRSGSTCTGTTVVVNTFNTVQQTPLVLGACNTAGRGAGSVPITCTTTSGISTVTIGRRNQEVLAGSVTEHFYAGCGLPTGCSSPSFGATTTCGNGTTVTAQAQCGGLLTVGSSRVFRLSCACSSIRWIVGSVATAPSVFGVDRVNGVCNI